MIELHRALVVHNGNVANSEATGDHVCKYKEMYMIALITIQMKLNIKDLETVLSFYIILPWHPHNYTPHLCRYKLQN